jgi:ribosomal protein L11 methyltransferase
VKTYPALDVHTDGADMLAALVDDFSPVALESRHAAVRVFFATSADRDAAQRAIDRQFDVTPVDVPDEDWARRSQADLKPVVVGRVTIVPSRESAVASQSDVASRSQGASQSQVEDQPPSSPVPSLLTIVIEPSMGFGTGHHATTRLCLAALQTVALDGREVVDVGTGSGVLAIAAVRLGAARALGIDNDPDAIQSARENLELNGSADTVSVAIADLAGNPLPSADVVTANLTGALLVRSAARLLDAVRPGGTLVVSGILVEERDRVVAAFAPAAVVWEREEDGWVGVAVKKACQ